MLYLRQRYRRHRARRRFANASRVYIADVRPGQVVRLVGKLRYLDEPLTAPLSERSCAYHEVRIGASVDDPIGKPHSDNGTDFLLQDRSGVALIRIHKAQMILSLDGVLVVPDYVQTSKGPVQRSKVYREGVLTADELVAAVGRATMEVAPASLLAAGFASAAPTGYRDPGQVLSLSSTPETPLLITDDFSFVPSS